MPSHVASVTPDMSHARVFWPGTSVAAPPSPGAFKMHHRIECPLGKHGDRIRTQTGEHAQ